MKKIILFLLSVTLIISLCSCDPLKGDKTVEPIRPAGFEMVMEDYLGIATSGVVFSFENFEDNDIVSYCRNSDEVYYTKNEPSIAVIFEKIRNVQNPIVTFNYAIIGGVNEYIGEFRDECDNIKLLFEYADLSVRTNVEMPLDGKFFWGMVASGQMPLLAVYDEDQKTQTHFVVDITSVFRPDLEMEVELVGFPRIPDEKIEVQITLEMYEGEQLLNALPPVSFYLTFKNGSYTLEGTDIYDELGYYYFPDYFKK